MFTGYHLYGSNPTKADLIISLTHYEMENLPNFNLNELFTFVFYVVMTFNLLTECDVFLSDLLWNHLWNGSKIFGRADGH